MIRMGSTVTDIDLGMRDILARVREEATFVDIGIQSDESEELLVIAAANEFGATINHPGGTPYGYKTKQHAEKGRVQFLKKGEGYMVLGETKPHTIEIPARPYIRSTVETQKETYGKKSESLGKKIMDGKLHKADALALMGQKIESDIKRTIIELRSPPNAKSTIRKKGSDNPLVNTGLLGGSIRYVVIGKESGDQ